VYFDYLSSFNVLIDSLLHNTLGEALLVMMFIEGEDGNKKRVMVMCPSLSIGI
jgi:hypothetical protein